MDAIEVVSKLLEVLVDVVRHEPPRGVSEVVVANLAVAERVRDVREEHAGIHGSRTNPLENVRIVLDAVSAEMLIVCSPRENGAEQTRLFVHFVFRFAPRNVEVLHDLAAANGRFLRHRPKRSVQCLNYGKLYQGQRPLPKNEGVPKASA